MGPLARLLGPPAVLVEGKHIELPVGKRSALWLYLVHRRRWIDRSELSFLLWPDTEQRRAYGNLRQVLSDLSRIPWGRAVESERLRVRCIVDSDAGAFEAAADAHRSDEALELYRAPFLDGFVVDDANEFMAWLERERAALHERWRTLALNAIDRLTEAGRTMDALGLVERLVADDPLDEDAARRGMQAARASGDARRALLIFAGLRTGLRREVGLRPSPRTTHLAHRIAEEAKAAAEVPIDIPPPLTVRDDVLATRLVGRERELHDLATLVASDARLVTVVAPGGMGKTWLARALQHRVGHAFGDGSAFVRLENVVGPYALVHAIADALGLRLGPEGELRRQLVTVIGDRELLLLLDGFEAHVGEHALITALLEGCPRLTLLVTSTVALEHSRERTYELGGLALVAPGAEAGNGTVGEAARLFARCAERVRGLEATPLDGRHVDAICRMLGGSPLAIDLCASWLAVAPIEAVRERLSESWEILHGDSVDRPPRHRDVRELLEAVWNSLRERDRSAWHRLALLRGTFDHEAALRVSGTGWDGLRRLKRHAIVRSVGDRLELHALVARFGREKAATSGEATGVGAALVDLFSERLGAVGRRGTPAVHDDDLPHLVAAWRHAVRTASFEALAAMAIGMQRSLWRIARSADAVRLCDEAVEVLAPASGPDRDVAFARLICGASSRHGPPPERARSAVRIAEARDDPIGQAIGHASLALDEPMRRARLHHRRSKVLFDRSRDPRGIIRTCLGFGGRLCVSGFYREASATIEEALYRSVAAGSRAHEAEAIAALGDVATLTGDLDTAEARASEARELFERLGVPLRAATCLGTLARIARIRRDRDAAVRWTASFVACQEAMGLGDALEVTVARLHLDYVVGDYDQAWRDGHTTLHRVGLGSKGLVAELTRLRLARIAMRRGDLHLGCEYVRGVLRPRQALERPRVVVDAIVAAAEFAVLQGATAEASVLLRSVLRQPAMDAESRAEAHELTGAAGLALDGPPAGVELSLLARHAHEVLQQPS